MGVARVHAQARGAPARGRQPRLPARPQPQRAGRAPATAAGDRQDLDSPRPRPVARLHGAVCLRLAMDITRHPELLERLAAAHALGTLRGGARRRFEHVARQSPTARAAALLWQERFAALTELQPTEAPSANVWKRIENLLIAQRPGASAPHAGAA